MCFLMIHLKSKLPCCIVNNSQKIKIIAHEMKYIFCTSENFNNIRSSGDGDFHD